MQRKISFKNVKMNKMIMESDERRENMTNIVRIVAEVPVETKRKLRMLCMLKAEGSKDMTIQAMIQQLIEEEYARKTQTTTKNESQLVIS